MPTWGPFYVTTCSDDAATGTVTWSNPGNIAAADNARAAAAFAAVNEITHYLKGLNPNPGLPSVAVVSQIDLEIERRNTQSGARNIRDNATYLVIGGAVVGSNLADTGTDWPAADTVKTYSFTVNYTAAQVNASDHGAVLSAKSVTAAAIPGAEVDFFRLTYIGTADAAGAGSTSGAASVAATGASLAAAAGSTSGAATVAASSASLAELAGSTSGAAAVSGTGAALAAADGSASGDAAVAGAGAALAAGDGATDGTASVGAGAGSLAAGSGDTGGAAVVAGTGETSAAVAPLEHGAGPFDSSWDERKRRQDAEEMELALALLLMT